MKQCKRNGIHDKSMVCLTDFDAPCGPPFWRWHPIVVVAGQQLTIQGGDLGQMFQDLGSRGTLDRSMFMVTGFRKPSQVVIYVIGF